MTKFCSLYSGSSGNCLFICNGETKILIDAGLSGKKIKTALHSIGENASELSAIVITHEHSDHIKGAGILSREFGIPIYSNEGTWGKMDSAIGNVEERNRVCFKTNIEFEIGNIGVKAFSVPHDASDPVGFNFFAENKKITTATDIGHVNDDLLECLSGSDLLLIESNHDVEMLKMGRYPWELKKRVMGDRGHLSNETAGNIIAHIVKKGTTKFLLGHLSGENNFPELAYETVRNVLREKLELKIEELFLKIASRDSVGEVLWV
jgi:phosphoribosyl 1,2-cyclic phosphodiesterase